MLLEEHAAYHKMAPKDVGLKAQTHIDVIRTTNQTGEQFHVQVPVYEDDTREAVKSRVNFFLSIIQDRMEDENKAVSKLNDTRQLKGIIERNSQNFVNKKSALDKRLEKGKLTKEAYEIHLKELQDGLKTANGDCLAKLDSMGEKFTPKDTPGDTPTEV
jgi:hypothetical protein